MYWGECSDRSSASRSAFGTEFDIYHTNFRKPDTTDTCQYPGHSIRVAFYQGLHLTALANHPWISLALLMAIPSLFKQFGRLILMCFEIRISKDVQGDTAGHWVETVIARNPKMADVRVVCQTGPFGHIDAYWPNRSILTLRPRTYNDSNKHSFNIAAHEYGHAAVHQEHPRLGLLFRCGRVSQILLGYLVIATILANILVTSATPGLMLHILFGLLLAAHAIVLADEAMASLRGTAVLKKLDPLRPSPAYLFLAWAIYFLGFIGRGLQWLVLPALLSSGLPAITPNSLPFHFDPTLFLFILSLILAKRAVVSLWNILKSEPSLTLSAHQESMRRDALGSFFGGFGAAIFTFFVSPLAADDPAIWLLLLGLVPFAIPLSALGESLVDWPFRLISKAVQPHEPLHPTPGVPQRPSAPNIIFEMLTGERSLRRLFGVVQLSYLPLLIFWWIQNLARLTL